ncbi:MAG: ABC transporter permease [Pseudomonadota bacterium]
MSNLVLPIVNLALAIVISGLFIASLGEDPFQAASLLLYGAFGYGEGFGYTLYYATNFMFTGLAVAVAFHAGLFNIGGEGQAYLGGLGVGLALLLMPPGLALILAVPLGAGAALLFGAACAAIPAWLQARRNAHIVITTIMFNFLVSALMVYLMVNHLREPGQMSPASRNFDPSLHLPGLHFMFEPLGIELDSAPLNISFLLALAILAASWVFIWRTRTGFEIRTIGAQPTAAIYAGIAQSRVVMYAMLLSGALAGMAGLNEIMGHLHRLQLDFAAGYGFTGIAVALMGRNHPAGILLASLLFGALYQGGAELSFDMEGVTRDLVVVIQGLVILFSGALEFMLHKPIHRLFGKRAAKPGQDRNNPGPKPSPDNNESRSS